MKRAQFGASSEKLRARVEQLELAIEALEVDEAERLAAAPVVAEAVEAATTKPARRPLPDQLARERVLHPGPCACPSCGGALRRIGEDVTESLDYVPGRFKVVRHVREAFSCRACETVVQAPAPHHAIARSRAGPGLLASIAVAKFDDHLPLYRQAEIFAREGVELVTSTLSGWVGAAAAAVMPLVALLRQDAITGSDVLHGDDTTIPVLAPGAGRTRTGRLWTYVRDERPHGGARPPAAVFFASPDRRGEHPLAHLSAFTPTTRRQHSRAGLRYETDLTDAEWAVIAALMPEPASCGRPPLWTKREVLNAIFYVLRGALAWRLIPKDLPPRSTAYDYFARWRDEGLFLRINHRLLMADRERVGREASPTAAVLDSQSVKTTESGGPRGYDAGKKVTGRKRQALVDKDGRALVLDPQPAAVKDRDGAVPVLRLSRRSFPFISRAFADAGYSGDRPASATGIAIDIVRKPKDQIGFAVHRCRWVVERFFAWISRNRRLWKDPEATLASARAFLYAAAIMILVRRIARAA